MNKFERRKIKTNIYKNTNTILYVVIFVMAMAITVAAAANRTDKITYVDTKKLASVEENSVEAKKITKIQSAKENPESSAEKGTVIDHETEAVTDAGQGIAQTLPMNETQETSETESTGKMVQVKVITETLYVRAERSTDAEIIGMAEMDQVYDVISNHGEWVEIRFEGKHGYINAEYISEL